MTNISDSFPVKFSNFLSGLICLKVLSYTGAPIPPEAIMISTTFFRKKFQTPWKMFPILPFHKNILDFHPPKFLMTFFSHRLQILNSPIFAVSVHFPYILKIIIPS